MQHIFKLSALLMLIVMFACSSENNNDNESETKETEEHITISGVVRSIEAGKDGFTAEVLTDEGDTYAALVSIVNLGGPENFKPFNIGDKVTISGTSYLLDEQKHLKTDKIIEHESTRTTLLISNTAFRGITIGDPIEKHSDYTEKQVLQTGEGDFEVYAIKDFNNNPAGYFLPDPNDEKLVGDIVVESLMAATKEGIKVGSTFGELKAALNEYKVHGSEIEGRTHAYSGNLSYRLDTANFSYELDEASISDSTKIIEIGINRSF